jgi:hypothetical protein
VWATLKVETNITDRRLPPVTIVPSSTLSHGTHHHEVQRDRECGHPVKDYIPDKNLSNREETGTFLSHSVTNGYCLVSLTPYSMV